MADYDDFTLVLDIGKSNAKLLVIDATGRVKARHVHANRTLLAIQTYPTYGALDVEGLQKWFLDTVPELNHRDAIRRISITTHGAAFCGIDQEGLVLPPIDYEWDGYGELANRHFEEVDRYADTGSPILPLGLNASLQLHWLIEHQSDACSRVKWWLPYAQYWAWWLSGEIASERSSLGCHTGLWRPYDDVPTHWAMRKGLSDKFPPLRWAWEELGELRPDLAKRLGISRDVVVHVGSHDSNACLARYLEKYSDATVVSTGTWCVLMAAGAQVKELKSCRDELINVAVDGRAVPTARFMAGREYAEICNGSDPGLASEAALDEVLQQGWLCLPAFADAGGPYASRHPTLLRNGEIIGSDTDCVPAPLRPALAALYSALMIDELVRRLDGQGPIRPVILEGPLASNPAILRALSGLLSDRPVHLSDDELEGTARGAWILSNMESALHKSSWSSRMSIIQRNCDEELNISTDELLRGARLQWKRILGDSCSETN